MYGNRGVIVFVIILDSVLFEEIQRCRYTCLKFFHKICLQHEKTVLVHRTGAYRHKKHWLHTVNLTASDIWPYSFAAFRVSTCSFRYQNVWLRYESKLPPCLTYCWVKVLEGRGAVSRGGVNHKGLRPTWPEPGLGSKWSKRGHVISLTARVRLIQRRASLPRLVLAASGLTLLTRDCIGDVSGLGDTWHVGDCGLASTALSYTRPAEWS